MTRHNTAADKELPKDLPQELWATECVWVRRGGQVPPFTPLYDGSYTVLQRSLCHFRLQMGDREDISTSRLKPCTGGTSIPTAWPAPEGNARRPSASASTSQLHHRQNPGTVFPGKPARFFARPGEASSSSYPQHNRGPPPGNGTTPSSPSSPLALTKKPGGAL